MITEQPDYNLELLKEHFCSCGDYSGDETKEEYLVSLQVRQVERELLVLISENKGEMDGFLLAHPDDKTLWIDCIWREKGSDLAEGFKGMEMARDWARERELTSMGCETQRHKMKAFKRHGFKEISLILKAKI